MHDLGNSLIYCETIKKKLFPLGPHLFHALFASQVECVCWEPGELRAGGERDEKKERGQNLQFHKKGI